MTLWNRILGKQKSGKKNTGKGITISAPDMEISREAVLVKYTGRNAVVAVPDGIQKIGAGAFAGNETIKDVILPPSVTEISNRAFERSSLAKIVIPPSVKEMGHSVFQYCRQLQSVTLPDHLECIQRNSFDSCNTLEKITLPTQLKEVGADAFEYCGITELRIPESMTYINKDAFRYMKCLGKVYLPRTLTGIGEGAFSFCDELREILIPEGVAEIGHSAFDACTNLRKVVFPQSLVMMDKKAFSRTGISDSQKLRETYDRLGRVITYPKPKGYQEITLAKMKFYYRSESQKSEPEDIDERISNFKYERNFTDALMIFKDQNGRKALVIYVAVPTFDIWDRERDSYRKLYLIPKDGEIIGVLLCGGYKVSLSVTYNDIRWADDRTEKMMKNTNIPGLTIS